MGKEKVFKSRILNWGNRFVVEPASDCAVKGVGCVMTVGILGGALLGAIHLGELILRDPNGTIKFINDFATFGN